MPKKTDLKVVVTGKLDPWTVFETMALIASMRYNVDVKVASVTSPDGTLVTRKEHEREKALRQAAAHTST